MAVRVRDAAALYIYETPDGYGLRLVAAAAASTYKPVGWANHVWLCGQWTRLAFASKFYRLSGIPRLDGKDRSLPATSSA